MHLKLSDKQRSYINKLAAEAEQEPQEVVLGIIDFYKENNQPKKRNRPGRAKGERDPLFEFAVNFTRERGCYSAEMLRGKLGVGYKRATRIVEQLRDAQILYLKS